MKAAIVSEAGKPPVYGDFPAPEQVINHLNGLWENQRAPGRRAAVVPTAEVRF